MQASRRIVFAAMAAAGVALAAAPGVPSAQQSFPVKPIRLVIATGAGSQPDGLARMFGQKLSERWGWGVVIDNRPGAGGALAAAMVARAAPDGHTLLYALPNFAISAVMQPSLPYDPIEDFAAVTHFGIGTNVLVASPALGETMSEFTRPDTSHGMLAPARTPRPVLERIGRDYARIVELPEVKERLQAISYVPAPSTPEEYGKLLRDQIEALNKLVTAAGLRPK